MSGFRAARDGVVVLSDGGRVTLAVGQDVPAPKVAEDRERIDFLLGIGSLVKVDAPAKPKPAARTKD